MSRTMRPWCWIWTSNRLYGQSGAALWTPPNTLRRAAAEGPTKRQETAWRNTIAFPRADVWLLQNGCRPSHLERRTNCPRLGYGERRWKPALGLPRTEGQECSTSFLFSIACSKNQPSRCTSHNVHRSATWYRSNHHPL